MLMVPKEYNIQQIPDLPEDENLRTIGQLFRHWPQWTLDDAHNPPGLALSESIFHDFPIMCNYRNNETWHARQRRKILTLQYEHNATKIFEVTQKGSYRRHQLPDDHHTNNGLGSRW